MEPTQTLPNLETEVANWQQNMLNGALTADDVEELTQHLRDEMAQLQEKGLNEEEAWLVARKRIGQPLAIKEEFSKVNPDYAASRNLLMLFWGGTIFMLLQSLFFAFPNLLWFMVTRFEKNHIDHLLTDAQTKILLNTFSLLSMALMILALTQANKVPAWFNNLVTKYSSGISLVLIISGSFLATINYVTITANLNNHSADGLGYALQLLGFIFYGSLIFCTAWFTMRYREQNFRNLKTFGANINWINSLALGAMLIMISLIGNMLQLHWLTAIITALLFIPAGWLIANSKTRALNLFMLQSFGMFIFWFIGYLSAHHSFIDTFISHSVLIIAMFMGYFINKRNQLKLQTN